MNITDVLTWIAAVVLLLVLVVVLVVIVRPLFQRGVVIQPFHVTGRDDPDDRLSRSLALMLQTRDRQVQTELEASQRELVSPERSGSDQGDAHTIALAGSLIDHPVTVPTRVLAKLPQISVKVAGIEVGDVAAWLDRLASRKRFLTFAVHFTDEEALVTGDLEALPDIQPKDVWLKTTSDPGEMITATAYSLLQRRIATSEGAEVVRALELNEFRALVETLSEMAELNRRITSGRAGSVEDFDALFERVEPLVEQFPRWSELIQLAAALAEIADRLPQARTYYERLRQTRRWGQLTVDDRAAIEAKIQVLGAAQPLIGRRRPAPAGWSIGHPDRNTAGTLGCLVRDGGDPERLYVLSVHQIAPPEAQRGDPILQPGPYDGGKAPDDIIATLERWVQPAPAAESNLDAAIALVSDPDQVSPEIEGVGIPTGVAEARVGMRVKKVGRSTGLTYGEIQRVGVSVRVGYGETGTFPFEGVIQCGGMSAGGDTGAILLDEENQAVGVLFAGSAELSLYLPIQPVLDVLEVTLVTASPAPG